jgi:hypothetical protein
MCGVAGATCSADQRSGWWTRTGPAGREDRCAICTAIFMCDATDHGDEHVESPAASQAMHDAGEEHRTRECRVCIAAGAPLRPDVRWVDSLRRSSRAAS